MPNTLALRHVAFEDLGLLEPILAGRGHAVRYVDVPVEPLDSLDPLAPDLLVVLGGPIGSTRPTSIRSSCRRSISSLAVSLPGGRRSASASAAS